MRPKQLQRGFVTSLALAALERGELFPFLRGELKEQQA